MASATNLLGAAIGAIADKALGKTTAKVELNGSSFRSILERSSPPQDNAAHRTERSSQSQLEVTIDRSTPRRDLHSAKSDDAAPVTNDTEKDAETAEAPKEMLALVNALSAIKTSLDAGQSIDPALLDQVETALQDLAAMLGIDLSAQLQQQDLSAADGPMAGLVQMMNQLAQPDATPEIAQRLAGLQDKLGALLTQLLGEDVPPDLLAKAGFDATKAIDPDLEAALQRLTATTVPDEPKLATPELKLPEVALTGKPAIDKSSEAPVQAETTTEPKPKLEASASAAAASDTTDGDKLNEDRPSHAARRDTHATPPPAIDASGNVAPSQPGQQEPIRLDAAANPRIIQTGYQTSQQQLNLPQIAIEMARQVGDGNTRFQIRLDPPELGRIDVRLEIDKGGQVLARLTVEKSETLDLMQRDQRALQQALQQAGLDSSKTNLEFSLKQNPFAGGQPGDGRQDGRQHADADGAVRSDEPEDTLPAVNLYRGALQASGLNIIA